MDIRNPVGRLKTVQQEYEEKRRELEQDRKMLEEVKAVYEKMLLDFCGRS